MTGLASPRRPSAALVPLLVALLAALLASPAAAQRAPRTTTQEAAHRAAEAHIQPGDRLVLKIFREPLLSDTLVLVNERGEAAFAKLGLVPVSRWTIAEAADSLRARFSRFLRDPALDLVVLRRVVVNGYVMKPGVLYLDVSATVRDAVAEASGLTFEGDPNKVYIVRDGQRLRVRDWQRDDVAASDLRSGDQVYVGARNWLARNALGVAGTAAVVVSVAASLIRR
jgi:protein involved in polysaccharide export with SLBB domain